MPDSTSGMPDKIRFGFTPVPYPRGAARSTADVADILEAKYAIVEHFTDMRSREINDALVQQMQRAISGVLRGRPPSPQPLQAAFDKIQRNFLQFILTKQLDGRVPGVPTMASLRGVSHRLKHPYAKRGARPSFYDTGLYARSFKVWME